MIVVMIVGTVPTMCDDVPLKLPRYVFRRANGSFGISAMSLCACGCCWGKTPSIVNWGTATEKLCRTFPRCMLK